MRRHRVSVAAKAVHVLQRRGGAVEQLVRRRPGLARESVLHVFLVRHRQPPERRWQTPRREGPVGALSRQPDGSFRGGVFVGAAGWRKHSVDPERCQLRVKRTEFGVPHLLELAAAVHVDLGDGVVGEARAQVPHQVEELQAEVTFLSGKQGPAEARALAGDRKEVLRAVGRPRDHGAHVGH